MMYDASRPDAASNAEPMRLGPIANCFRSRYWGIDVKAVLLVEDLSVSVGLLQYMIYPGSRAVIDEGCLCRRA